MRILLDTCTFLWLIGTPDKLSGTARDLVEDAENQLFLSVASCWEIAVKVALNRLDLPNEPTVFFLGCEEST